MEVSLLKKKPVPGVRRSGEASDEVSPKSLAVPRSAVLWATFGNAWVYVATDDDSFHRQQVEVGTTAGNATTITRGLEDDDRIVIKGAAALYAEEFKGQIQLDDDD